MTVISAYSYVRMSTEGQLKGDSLRRQLEQSSRYASEHGLTLIKTFNLADYGVSAFKGQNVASGNLGRFLDAVRAGKIARGSYLLVESLDRLSRQNPRLALPQFLEIVNQGIVLVTLADQRKYTAESVRLEDLLYSLVVMSRAHEESQMKSQRIAAAWANKRAYAAEKKLTGRCPAWLKLKGNRKSFDIIPDRVAIIERIFDEAKAGIGGYAIARRLNADKIPAFITSRGWHKSSVDKIITGRAVLGELQPHRLIDGKRVPDGGVIQAYFPQIIPEEVFNAALAQRLMKKKGGGGRQGDRVSNLFSKIGRCAYCGGSLRYENKGKGSKGGKFLACDNAVRGKGCVGGRWKYNDFEASFLSFVEEIDLGALIDAEEGAASRAKLENERASLNGALLQAEAERENAYKLIEQPGVDVDYVATKLKSCGDRLIALKNNLAAIEAEINAQAANVATYYQSKQNIHALITGIAASEGRDGYKLRAEIAGRLKSLISTISLAPLGYGPLSAPEEQNEADERPYFTVAFRDGTTRIVTPDRSDPLKLELMMSGPKPKVVRATKRPRQQADLPS